MKRLVLSVDPGPQVAESGKFRKLFPLTGGLPILIILPGFCLSWDLIQDTARLSVINNFLSTFLPEPDNKVPIICIQN